MPLALIADLIKTQIISLDAATEAIQAACETIAVEAATLDTAVGVAKDELVTLDVAVGTMKDDVALIKADIASGLNKMVEGAPTAATAIWGVQNATPVAAAATAQAVRAAPGASSRLVMNGVTFSNVTGAQVAILQLEDEDDNILAGPFSVGVQCRRSGSQRQRPVYNYLPAADQAAGKQSASGCLHRRRGRFDRPGLRLHRTSLNHYRPERVEIREGHSAWHLMHGNNSRMTSCLL